MNFVYELKALQTAEKETPLYGNRHRWTTVKAIRVPECSYPLMFTETANK